MQILQNITALIICFPFLAYIVALTVGIWKDTAKVAPTLSEKEIKKVNEKIREEKLKETKERLKEESKSKVVRDFEIVVKTI